MTDDDLLSLVRSEHDRAIGLDNDAELTGDRERALQYAKGDISKDVPSLPNRSAVVSTDIADAVESVLPDLIEMFTGGEDVASFSPRGPEDEDGAKQETDFLYHALFDLNDGFGNLYTAFKDALLLKTGVWTFWWEDDEHEEERFCGSPVEYFQFQQQAQQMGVEIVEAKAEPAEDGEEPEVEWVAKRIAKYGCAKFKAVPPEDFAVARDTVNLRDATYCVMRSRPRAQDLIADGYDADKVAQLPGFAPMSNDAVAVARDTASESAESRDAASDMLRTVEILHHCIKIVEADGKPQYYSVVTDSECKVMLDSDKIGRVCFAAITPYPVAHRFYGRSLADVLVEIQKIKSVLWRMQLDAGYFALNQRPEIAMSDANEYTVDDYLQNTPGRPIRSKTGNALRYPATGQFPFDVMSALEYASVAGEQRTGVVRNAQGLNPDTLHDTAKGAMALMTQAQKRVRLIARIFAEGGLKDLFLGMHALMREHGSPGQQAKLRGEWVTVDPTTWGNRNDMTIEIGVGAGGREQELMALQGVMGMIETMMQAPQAAQMVSPENLYNLAKKVIERSGLKNPDAYITDPAKAGPQPPPPPDPKMIEAQGKLQLQKEKQDGEMALAREKAQAEMALAQSKMRAEMELAVLRQHTQSMGPAIRPGGAVG